MKFEITGRPVFWFALTDSQFDILRRLSGTHYDGTCRAASSPGGFIYGWGNRRSFTAADTQIGASWRELDLCLKILEGASQLEPPLYQAGRELSVAIRGAMCSANDHAAQWAYQVEI